MKTVPVITVALTTCALLIAVVSCIPVANEDSKTLASEGRAKRSGWNSEVHYQNPDRFSSYGSSSSWSVRAAADSTVAPVVQQLYNGGGGGGSSNQYGQSTGTGSFTTSSSASVHQSYNTPVHQSSDNHMQESNNNSFQQYYDNHVREGKTYGNHVNELKIKGKGEGGQSYIWQSTPDYTYSIYQRHPLIYRHYTYYPNGWSIPYVRTAW